MRHGPCSVCSAALIGLGLAAGAARADPKPGWVDPPARAQPASPAIGAAVPPNASPAVAGEGKAGESKTGEGRSSEPAPAVREARRPPEPATIRRPPHRLARAPAAPAPDLPATNLAMNTAPDARFPAWAGTAQRLSRDYLDTVSSANARMIDEAPRFYGERVRFHGRLLSLAALLAEKRRFARRWPERRYEAQAGTTRTACSSATATCIVRTTLDYRAASPARDAHAQGVAELVIEVAFPAGRPVIVSESSRVLRRTALGAVRAAQHGA